MRKQVRQAGRQGFENFCMAEFYYTNENKKARCKKLDFAFVPIFEKVSKTLPACLPYLPFANLGKLLMGEKFQKPCLPACLTCFLILDIY